MASWFSLKAKFWQRIFSTLHSCIVTKIFWCVWQDATGLFLFIFVFSYWLAFKIRFTALRIAWHKQSHLSLSMHSIRGSIACYDGVSLQPSFNQKCINPSPQHRQGSLPNQSITRGMNIFYILLFDLWNEGKIVKSWWIAFQTMVQKWERIFKKPFASWCC